MGIKGLTGLLTEHAPKSMSDHDIKTMFGRKVAIDASMSLYQFLIAVRQKDGEQMTNEAGEVTSHLLGTFYRTIRMVDNGIKPCYVFDGKPPDMKGGVLKDRLAKREKAKEDEAEAKETGTVEDVDKMSRRQVRVTKEQNAEVQRLLKLMGIPCVVAPGEAEAQCAELARGGKVYGAGSEDMDTLTFNSPILLRHLTFSEAKKAPIMEVHLDKALEGLGMEMEQFIELCILMGCDYLEPIKGIGPSTAYKLMKEHGSLKHVVAHLRGKQAARDGEVAAAVAAESEEEEEEIVESEKESEDGHGEQGLDGEDKVDEEEGGSIKKGGKKRARVTDDSDEDDDNDDFPPPSKAGNSDSDADEDNPEPSASKAKGKGKASPVKKSTKKAAPKAAGGGGKKAAPKKRGGIIIPEDWNWQGAKELFLRPDVVKSTDVEIEWTAPDVEGLVDFLVREKGFNEDRVRNGAGKLQKMINAKQQGRLDGFFKVLPKDPSSSKKAPEPAAKGKRKGTAGGKDDKKDTKKAKTTVKKK